ncbi:hypothetical protein A3F29_00650 [Candidatus Roizmanbacteria bacterium RIFCSPHIGHO2_12_FULL_33_9]|uniref:N-acetyltransferase domain-containing protein n=1 Tax=Candidatus Roizmanbacteria bacterium RIFCSPHIGHO2_12_FULL_33_9 TaxID=1802045 RepID=A0A1F7HJ58_9BACT|nr:MAG: hypothetical protein A3F29_00650 [Candidatus Roizmanbacteria bacterium RIFCSPHIGHO2_12_FULL_33_9]
MNILVRRAKLEDWRIIQKLNNEVFIISYKYDKNLNMKWPFSKEGIDYYKNAIKSKEYFCYIAEKDEKEIGYLIGLIRNFSYRANKSGEIENMGVSLKYRGKGVGSKLVDEFKKWCKKRRVNFIKVSTYFYYQKGITFYKKQGMKPLDVTLEGLIKL